MNLGDEFTIDGVDMTVISFDHVTVVGVSEDQSTGLQTTHIIPRKKVKIND